MWCAFKRNRYLSAALLLVDVFREDLCAFVTNTCIHTPCTQHACMHRVSIILEVKPTLGYPLKRDASVCKAGREACFEMDVIGEVGGDGAVTWCS